MSRPIFMSVLALGLMVSCVIAGLEVRAQTPGTPGENTGAEDAQPAGMEVQARGQVHEAFAEPVDNRPGPGRIVPKQPPAAIEEVPPDKAPSGDMQWIPGYWAWEDDRNDFLWVSGIWRQAPPERQWVPGNWIQAEGGWQWVAGFWAPVENKQVSYYPQPPAPIDAGPSVPAPTAVSTFVPGNWVYMQTRYVWRPGFWIEPRIGWVWIPAHFVWTPAGYIFVEGHWDLELSRRGLLFAPVYFTTPLYARPGWTYCPSFVVQTDFVLGCLFVRRGCPSYFFGDYFGNTYVRGGYVAFCDFRPHRYGYDPLFSYYRWANRDVPRWDANLRSLYVARANDVAIRPPRTLVQQTTVINNININKNVNNINVTNVNKFNALTSLNQINKTGVVKLQPVPPARLAVERSQAKKLEQVSLQRGQQEHALKLKAGPNGQSLTGARVAQLDLPAIKPVTTTGPKMLPPPLPTGHKAMDITDSKLNVKGVTGTGVKTPTGITTVIPPAGGTTTGTKTILPSTGTNVVSPAGVPTTGAKTVMPSTGTKTILPSTGTTTTAPKTGTTTVAPTGTKTSTTTGTTNKTTGTSSNTKKDDKKKDDKTEKK